MQCTKTRGPECGRARRFWDMVERRGADECWPWTGAKRDNGYGHYSRWEPDRRCCTSTSAHREAYRLKHGVVINPDFCVCHRCDNRLCCNPAHLFLGTHKDNAEDRNRKGRQAKGARCGAAKLTEANVLEIRRLCAAGESQRSVALQFGVHQSTVWRIIKGRDWSHVPLPVKQEAAEVEGVVDA